MTHEGTLDRHPFTGCTMRSEEEHERCEGSAWIRFSQCHWPNCGKWPSSPRHAVEWPKARDQETPTINGASTRVRDILELAHCCDELLAFAATGDIGRTPFVHFRGLWNAIDRPDWLTWLMRHTPDQFEDSWRDAVSVVHALADARANDWGLVGIRLDTLNQSTCNTIRLHVRLRS